MARKLLALTILLALTLLAAGCGGGDGSSNGSAMTANQCRELEQTATRVGEQFSAALTGAGGKTDVQEAARLFDEVTSKAPEEIRPDFQTINVAFSKLAGALEGVDLSGGKQPDAATIQRLQKVTSEINTTKLDQASRRISAWAQENCKS